MSNKRFKKYKKGRKWCRRIINKLNERYANGVCGKAEFNMLPRQMCSVPYMPFVEKIGGKCVKWIPIVCEEDCIDELPCETIQVLQNVMEEGKRKGKDSFGKYSVEDHVLRAIWHLASSLEALSHEDDEPHLDHAFTRCMLAVATRGRSIDNSTAHSDVPVDCRNVPDQLA